MLRLIIVTGASIGLMLLVAFVASRGIRSLRQGMSIRMQVFFALAAVVGAFALGLGAMVIDRIEARANRFATAAAEEQARVIAQLLGGELEQHGLDLATLARHLPERTAHNGLSGVELYGPNEQLLFRSTKGFAVGSTQRVSVSAAIVASGQPRGKVRVEKATLAMKRMLADFAPTILVISLVLSAAAALAAAWIGRTIAGPIEALSNFAQNISSGQERSAVPPVPWGREVTRLTESLNSMRRQLEGRPFVETFTADLSHELKNPVAAIRASAEVLEEGALEEPEEARRFVRRITESVARIERLLSELLSLARIEARGIETLEILNIDELVVQSIKQCTAPERASHESEHSLAVRGHPLWLSRALDNMIENALLHSPEGTAIALTTSGTGDDIHVEIRSQGHIPPHARAELFRRFFTTREDKGGTGLGLPIIKAIAEAHRGEVRLMRAGPPEVVFRLTLPRA